MPTHALPTYGEFYARLKNITEEFIHKFNQGTDPDDFMSLTELEALWGKLNDDTREVYSDLVNQLVGDIKEKELVRKKKLNSQSKG